MTALERLQAAFPSPAGCKVALYVPSTLDRTKATDNTQEVQQAARWMAKHFGGCTTLQASGYWIDDAGALVVERPMVVYSFAPVDVVTLAVADLWAYAEQLRERMGQDCISLEINGNLYLVDGEINPFTNF